MLIEVLIAIVILSVVMTTCVGAVSQALRISEKAGEWTRARLAMEGLLFELRSGERLDLLVYGGRGKMEEKYQYEIQSDQLDVTGSVIPFYFYLVQARLSWKGARDFLDLNLFVKE